MVLLGFMVVTGISHFLQFQVIGSMYSMNSRAILTVGQPGRNSLIMLCGRHATRVFDDADEHFLILYSSN
jgi:hypothetical protein